MREMLINVLGYNRSEDRVAEEFEAFVRMGDGVVGRRAMSQSSFKALLVPDGNVGTIYRSDCKPSAIRFTPSTIASRPKA